MEWLIKDEDRTSEDPSGVEGFVKRMELELRDSGPPLQGFYFLSSAMEMLKFTREIEDEIQASKDDSDLYVGFQTVDKMIIETARYTNILNSGVNVVAFGQSAPPETMLPNGMEWVTLSRNTKAFENQWYLISSTPTPIGFVAWEISEEDKFAIGGLSEPGKLFKGFATNDPRILNPMINHLNDIKSASSAFKLSQEELESQLKKPIDRILALTQMVEPDPLSSLKSQAINLAMANNAELVLFEVSAASYLISPYPEEDKTRWVRILNENDLVRFGRESVAKQIIAIKNDGINAGAILPTTHGFKHLSEWAEKETVDLIMIPDSMVQPSLLDRLRGYSLKVLLENTNKQVVVVNEDGSMWHANPEKIHGEVKL